VKSKLRVYRNGKAECTCAPDVGGVDWGKPVDFKPSRQTQFLQCSLICAGKLSRVAGRSYKGIGVA
jgi:hypothetical protein